MHYYIYPKGKIGKTLGKMFDFLEMSDSYSFIDDYQEGITLKEQAPKYQEKETIIDGDFTEIKKDD